MVRCSIVVLLASCASQAASEEPAAPPVVVDPAPAPSPEPAAKEQTPEAESKTGSAPETPERASGLGDDTKWTSPAKIGSIGKACKSGAGTTGGTNANGPLDSEMVSCAVQGHLKEIRTCYKTELAKQPDLSGRLNVRLEINADGHVNDVRAESSVEPSVDACIIAVFKRMSFPKPKDGKAVVRYPLIFQAAQ